MKEYTGGGKHSARLCHLKLWSDFNGYGFNLRTDTKKNEQKVDSVEPFSPSESGGLKLGDIILAVNGTSVDGASHLEVVRMIKQNPTDVSLLVIQPSDLAHFENSDNLIENVKKAAIFCETSTITCDHLTKADRQLMKADQVTLKLVSRRRQKFAQQYNSVHHNAAAVTH